MCCGDFGLVAAVIVVAGFAIVKFVTEFVVVGGCMWVVVEFVVVGGFRFFIVSVGTEYNWLS